MAKKSGLGRGYMALMSDNTAESGGAQTVRITEIEPNPDQPRRYFDTAALEELSENIKLHGLLQPIVVRPQLNGNYQIVAGERRWRACMQAGLNEVPVIIKDLDDAETMELALIENLQREDLNAIEEAEGYKNLMQTFSLTQEEVAKKVGKSRSAVANALRLLELGKYTQYIISGEISAGHGRALLSLDSDELREQAIEMIKNGASVRQIEQLAKLGKSKPKSETTVQPKNLHYTQIELTLKEELGRKVQITPSAKGGKLEFEFYSEDDLNELLKKLF